MYQLNRPYLYEVCVCVLFEAYNTCRKHPLAFTFILMKKKDDLSADEVMTPYNWPALTRHLNPCLKLGHVFWHQQNTTFLVLFQRVTHLLASV